MDVSSDHVPVIVSSDNVAERTRTQKETSSGQGMEALKDITFGSIAGMAGKYIEYPFDTVKVRLQSQPDGLPLRYTGPLDCFKQSLRKDGFLGIYRGISAPLFGAAVETSSLFFSVSRNSHLFRVSTLTGPTVPSRPESLRGLAYPVRSTPYARSYVLRRCIWCIHLNPAYTN